MLEFQIRNLGRVRRGHIKLAPLTILVGKNNTGKSYAATLIWSLSNLSTLLNERDARARRPRWYVEFLESQRSEADSELFLSPERLLEVVEYVNDTLRRNGPAFLTKLFAYNGFKEARINLIQTEFKTFTIRVSAMTEKIGAESGRDNGYVQFVAENGNKFFEAFYPSFIWKENIVTDMIFEQIVQYALQGAHESVPFRSEYIPAARTGLMLALNSLASDILGVKESNTVRELPLPLRQFLRNMVNANFFSPTTLAKKLSTWLDEKVIGGAIEAERREGAPDFKYKPRGLDVELPLYATSSMITELAPFSVALKSDVRGRHLILEEPEAHLHLEAQREMARAISRMVSSGAQITLTTHSDTFMQQINNLVSLYNHPQRAKLMRRFGYTKADLINPSDVAVFEFGPNENGTEIQRLECTDSGFVVQSLNDTLVALAKETMEIRENQ